MNLDEVRRFLTWVFCKEHENFIDSFIQCFDKNQTISFESLLHFVGSLVNISITDDVKDRAFICEGIFYDIQELESIYCSQQTSDEKDRIETYREIVLTREYCPHPCGKKVFDGGHNYVQCYVCGEILRSEQNAN